MRKDICILAAAMIAAFVITGVAHADAAHDRCMEKASSSDAYSDCGKQWLAREEAALAVAWKNEYGSLDSSEAKASLLQEQRNWIRYKDSACRFLGTAEFGSMGWSQRMVPCIARVVRARADQLRAYSSEPLDGPG